jgi:hypothetical protein
MLAVVVADTATVDYTGVVGRLGGDVLGQPLADGGVNFLGLGGGGDLAGSDGPVG